MKRTTESPEIKNILFLIPDFFQLYRTWISEQPVLMFTITRLFYRMEMVQKPNTTMMCWLCDFSLLLGRGLMIWGCKQPIRKVLHSVAKWFPAQKLWKIYQMLTKPPKTLYRYFVQYFNHCLEQCSPS